MIHCEEAIEQIDNILDDGQAPGAELQAHLDGCAECRRHYASLQALEQRLQAAASTHSRELPREVSNRALNAFHRSTVKKPGLRWYWLSAACVVLGAIVGLALYFSQRQPEKQDTMVNISPPPRIAVLPAVQPAPPELTALVSPDQPLVNEQEKLATDVRSVESFLLRCLAVSETEKRG